MKSFIRFFNGCAALLVIALTGVGCVGLITDSVVKAVATGGTYEKVAPTFPPILPGHGRLIVYRTADSTKTTLVLNIGLQKNPISYELDQRPGSLLWSSFTRFDLPLGPHSVGCNEFETTSPWKVRRNPPRTLVNLDLAEGAAAFVRFDIADGHPVAVQVQPEVAASELAKIAYQKEPIPR